MNLGNDISYLLNNYFELFLLGIASTSILALVGTGVGLLLGIFLGLGKNIKVSKEDLWFIKLYKYPLKWICTIYSSVIRGTPMMVQALIFKYGCQMLGLNWNAILPGVPVLDGWFIAGLIVITFNTAAYMGEIIRSGLNGVDKGEIEGARALGMNSFQTMRYVALPQAIRNSLPTIGNEWIVNIKDSSVLNVIGLTELFAVGKIVITTTYNAIGVYVIIGLIYLTLTIIFSLILKIIEKKLNGEVVFNLKFFRHSGSIFGGNN